MVPAAATAPALIVVGILMMESMAKVKWNEFEDEVEQGSFKLIPGGTLVKVKMYIQRGGYDDIERGWTGGYAKFRPKSVCLEIKCMILEGEYASRAIWSRIGLYSVSSDKYGEIGRKFVKAILMRAEQII